MISIKCVVIGDGGVGKSSLLISYTTNTFPQDYVPTVFDNYSTTVAINDISSDDGEDTSDPQLFKLNLWDTAGQEEYDTLRPLSYPQTDIFLLCFSVDSRASFINAKTKWCKEVLETINLKNSDIYMEKNKYPILLVGTKSDLRENEATRELLAKSNSSFITKEEVDEFVKENSLLGYVECSAATQTGVSNVFETAVKHNIPEKVKSEKSIKINISEDMNKESIVNTKKSAALSSSNIENAQPDKNVEVQKEKTETISKDKDKISTGNKVEDNKQLNKSSQKKSNKTISQTSTSESSEKLINKNKKIPQSKEGSLNKNQGKNKNCNIM